MTIKTGKHSSDPEKVQISIKYGNKEDELGLFPWQKMHGVRATYMKHSAHKQTTIYDDNYVTLLVTGEWKVAVEPPA